MIMLGMRLSAIVIALMVVAGCDDKPKLETAGDLQSLCQPTNARVQACVPVIGMIWKTLQLVAEGAKDCFFVLDKSATPESLRDVVVGYINTHPESIDADIQKVVRAALAEKYPCPK